MQRKCLSKFRLGLLHLRIETGRFVRPRIEPEDSGAVENELHFLLFCSKYEHFRQVLFNHIPNINSFLAWDCNTKFKFLVNDASMVKQTAIYIVDAFDYRSTLI